jgi:hypothetical protein
MGSPFRDPDDTGLSEAEMFDIRWSFAPIAKVLEAGGPTGTIRDPNSTPMVTLCVGLKRPSQRRMVSYGR